MIAHLDILAHASTTGEPFGQVVAEGMIAGKPVVATNGGGVPEIIEDGISGLLVPMDDAPALAAALVRLIENPEQAAAIAKAGRQRILGHFMIEHTAGNVQGDLRRVARGLTLDRKTGCPSLWPCGLAAGTAACHDRRRRLSSARIKDKH